VEGILKHIDQHMTMQKLQARRPAGEMGLPEVEAPLSREHFAFFKQLAMRQAGIMLPDYKRSMVYRRLHKRLVALGLRDFESYIALLSGKEAASELQSFTNALTTNKTEFFREEHHFIHLRAVALQEWRMRSAVSGMKRLRIWSAGCSSGQEPYSIAMTLLEAMPDAGHTDSRILATDIDTEMTTTAHEAFYDMDLLAQIPGSLRAKYVEQSRPDETQSRFRQKVRNLIQFNTLNLHGSWPMSGLFDIVFCRNVIIYFDKQTQAKLFERFANQMVEGGYLYIGHSETLYKVCDRFEPVGQSIYRKIA
jgi:chemotaxis protein methyltransferase CheR